MSGYAMAASSVANFLTGASADAAYEAAYGKFYTAYQGMHNAARARSAAEANIAAIKQDKIHTDMIVDMQQDRAEAEAKVMAAVSGAEGQSVRDSIYQTEVNSSVAKQNSKAKAEQSIESQLASVYNAQSTMLAVDNPQVQDVNIGDTILTATMGMFADNTMRSGISEGVGGIFTVDQPTSEPMAMVYEQPSGDILLS